MSVALSPAALESAARPAKRPFSRERLFARLDDALAHPVVLVVADEGYGKSTLLRDYFEARGVPHRRFTARRQHAKLVDLARAFAEVFEDVRPALARSAAAAALRSGNRIGALARTWAREHLRDVKDLVVLDDMHLIADDPACIEFITALIEASVPDLRWIVAVRDAATLPVPRWLARNIAALPIDADELCVRSDEVFGQLTAGGRVLDTQTREALIASTNGWPLGLVVALRTDDLTVPQGQAAIYDDIVSSALDHFKEGEREQLIEIALAEQFDASLLGALECSAGFLARLQASELVRNLDGRRYDIGEPFRARLERVFRSLDDDVRGTIVTRVAAALECVGRWSDALLLRARYGEPDRLVTALERDGFSALERGETTALAFALERLGEEQITRRPTALGLRAALAALDENYDVSEAWYSLALRDAQNAERRAIVLRYGLDLVRRGRPDVIELLEAETARDAFAHDQDADAALWALLGTAYVGERNAERAAYAARQALQRLPGVRDPGVRARVLHQAAYVALDAGDHQEAKSLATRALARADEIFLYDVAARALSILFNVAMLYEEDVASAREALLRLEAAGRRAGNDSLRLYAIVNAYAIEVDAGNMGAVARLNRELADMRVLLTPMISEGLLPAQALRAAWSGRFDHAYELLAPGAPKLFDEDRIAYRWAEVALYAAAAGKHDEARHAREMSRTSLARIDVHQPLAARAIAYLALAETMAGNMAAATETVREAGRAAQGLHRRICSLVEAVAAVVACRDGLAEGLRTLAECLDDLEANDLGGVGLLIGRLPLETIEYSPKERCS